MRADAQPLRDFRDSLASIGNLNDRIPPEIITEIDAFALVYLAGFINGAASGKSLATGSCCRIAHHRGHSGAERGQADHNDFMESFNRWLRYEGFDGRSSATVAMPAKPTELDGSAAA